MVSNLPGVITVLTAQSAQRRDSAPLDILQGGDRGDHSGEEGSKPKLQKARSAVSGSSGGSSHATDSLRKGITLRSREMEGSLIALRRALVLVFIVVVVVNAVSTLITTQLFAALITASQFVELNGQRGVSLQRAYAQIQRLRYWGDELLFLSPAAALATRARLTEYLEDLDEMHRELYTKSTLTPDSPAATSWGVANILVHDLNTDAYNKGLCVVWSLQLQRDEPHDQRGRRGPGVHH
jgi:hypothetical protein